MKPFVTACCSVAIAGALATSAPAQYPGYANPFGPGAVAPQPTQPGLPGYPGYPPYPAYPQYAPYPQQPGLGYPPVQMPPGYPQPGMAQPQPSAQPQQPGQGPQAGQPQTDEESCDCAACQEGRYGWHPVIKRILGMKHHSTHTCHPGHHRNGLTLPHLGIGDWFHGLKNKYGPPSAPEQAPYANGGTLAFPNHPFARGPRDFFMMEQP